MSSIRQRTKNKIYAGLIGALATAILATGLGIYGYTNWSKEKAAIKAGYEEQLKEAELIKQENLRQRKQVLIAKEDIVAGTQLNEDHFTIGSLPSDQIPLNIIMEPEDLNGKITKINISKNGSVIPSMLFEDGVTPDDLRKAEYSEIMLPTKLKNDDYVDVRINFPTGQDYIVLGKKKVEDLLNGTVWFEINEQEILTMSSAIVDAYLNEAQIYALTYVDPFMQDSPTVNYPVNPKVLDLILTDPNVIRNAKSELNKAARTKLDQDLDSMSAEDKQKVSNSRSNTIREKQDKTSADQQIQNNNLNINSPSDFSNSSSQSQDSTMGSGNMPPETSSEATMENDIFKEAVTESIQP